MVSKSKKERRLERNIRPAINLAGDGHTIRREKAKSVDVIESGDGLASLSLCMYVSLVLCAECIIANAIVLWSKTYHVRVDAILYLFLGSPPPFPEEGV